MWLHKGGGSRVFQSVLSFWLLTRRQLVCSCCWPCLSCTFAWLNSPSTTIWLTLSRPRVEHPAGCSPVLRESATHAGRMVARISYLLIAMLLSPCSAMFSLSLTVFVCLSAHVLFSCVRVSTYVLSAYVLERACECWVTEWLAIQAVTWLKIWQMMDGRKILKDLHSWFSICLTVVMPYMKVTSKHNFIGILLESTFQMGYQHTSVSFSERSVSVTVNH